MHSFAIDGCEHELRIVRFSGWERISELFSFEITVVASSDVELVLAELLGHEALLTMDAGGDAPRQVHGRVARFEHAEEGRNVTGYRVLLVPAFERLRHRFDTRIFQELPVAKIVERVLTAAGLASTSFRFRLQGSYPDRPYCVQYRESDFDFVARLCEEDGIHWYFEHHDGGHVLVFADDPSAHAVIGGDPVVPYRAPTGALMSAEHVSAFAWSEEVRTGKAVLRDYDFKRPATLLESSAAGAANADLEHYDHPGHFSDGPLPRRATTRQEELATPREQGRGASACARFCPGRVFVLAEHAKSAFDRDYLLVAVAHRGADPHHESAADVPYENDFEVARADAAWRPPRITPKPRVHGIQTAVVTGPAGEEIYVDEYGRIKVQFHWDRQGKKDDHTTCFMRVAQPWAGAGFGAMFLPRVGDEVVVSFVDGDPDRPLVTASVYNAQNVLPYALPGHKTRSTIKTNSTPGGGGYNELRFEDKKGAEEVYLQAEKDWNTKVKHDRALDVGRHEKIAIGGDRTDSVGQSETNEVGINRQTTIGADDTQSVGANRTVTVSANFSHTVGGNLAFASGAAGGAVHGTIDLTVDDDVKTVLEKNRDDEIKGSSTTSIAEAFSLAVGKDAAIRVDGAAVEEIGKTLSIDVTETYKLTVGDGSLTIEKNGNITLKGKEIVIEGTGPIKVKGEKVQVESQGTIDVKASGAVKVQGGTVDVN
jgi:type VI secretion system secreted protein VgrG